MTDADLISELREQLRQRDARIAELERTVGELNKVIEAWKRGHRVRPGGKLGQKPRDPRKAKGRGPGRPEGHEGSSRPAPTKANREVPVPLPEFCACGGAVEPTGEEPGEQFVEELIPARIEVVCYRRCRGRCRECNAAVMALLPDGLGANPKIGVRAQAEIPLCQGSCRPAPLQKGTAEMDLVGQKDRARWPRTQNSSSLGCFSG